MEGALTLPSAVAVWVKSSRYCFGLVTARQIYSSSSAVRRGARLSNSMPKFSSVCLSCSVSSPVSVTGCGNSPSHSPNTSTAAMFSNRRVAAEPTVTQSCRAGTAPMSVSSKYSSSAADSSSADRGPSSPGNSVDMSASAPVSRFHSRTVSPASRVLPSRSSVSADAARLSLTPSPLRYPNSALLCSAGVSATARWASSAHSGGRTVCRTRLAAARISRPRAVISVV